MANKDSTLTQKELNDWLIYKEGNLFYKTKARGRFQHDKAGSLYSNGYIMIVIKGKRYLAHRLIFFMHHGFFPKLVDHINRNKTDNIIENLREANISQNAWNRNLSKANTSGVNGVIWRENKKYYEATCTVNGKYHYLGCFKDIKEAEQKVKNFKSLHCGHYAS